MFHVSPSMIIGGLQELSLIDYPGKLACTVFLAGCNFRCPWCYNPELISPEMTETQPKISEKNFFDFLKERKGILEGVVFCGGEPTVQPELIDWAKKIKEMDFALKLDTNGSHPALIKELVKNNLVDYIAMDVKAPKNKYIEAIGIDHGFLGSDQKRQDFWLENIIEKVQESIDFLKEGNKGYEFRTTVVPGLIEKTDVLEIAKWISPADKYFLQEFKANDKVEPEFRTRKPYQKEYLIEILRLIEPFFEICGLRAN